MQTSAGKTFAAAITRWLIAFAVLALAVSPSFAGMALSSRGKVDLGDTGTQVLGRSGPRFRVKGKVGGLYPGLKKPLKLKFRNPQRYAIKVRKLRVMALPSDKSGCDARWVAPKKKMKVSILIPRRSKARMSYPVKMRRKAPNACQGAKWTLKFWGAAVSRK